MKRVVVLAVVALVLIGVAYRYFSTTERPARSQAGSQTFKSPTPNQSKKFVRKNPQSWCKQSKELVHPGGLPESEEADRANDEERRLRLGRYAPDPAAMERVARDFFSRLASRYSSFHEYISAIKGGADVPWDPIGLDGSDDSYIPLLLEFLNRNEFVPFAIGYLGTMSLPDSRDAKGRAVGDLIRERIDGVYRTDALEALAGIGGEYLDTPLKALLKEPEKGDELHAFLLAFLPTKGDEGELNRIMDALKTFEENTSDKNLAQYARMTSIPAIQCKLDYYRSTSEVERQANLVTQLRQLLRKIPGNEVQIDLCIWMIPRLKQTSQEQLKSDFIAALANPNLDPSIRTLISGAGDN